MKAAIFTRYALALTIAATLAACGGSPPPIGAPGTMRQSRVIATHAERGSFMLPEAESEDLLYVTDVRRVTVYSYPAGKYVGTLKHFYIAQGMCVDGVGDVFIADLGYGKIFEYAHGGTKRLATLQSEGKPAGCSIDPTTGNLAVSSLSNGSGSRAGSVAVFENARGKPNMYRDSAFEDYYFCGYDDKGNLFVDGLPNGGGSGSTLFAELPKGSGTLTNIALNEYIQYPGGVQWDGNHVAVGDQFTNIYRFSVDGGQAMLAGTTHMGSGANNVKQFWIQNHTLIAPNTIAGHGGLGSKALLFNYPAGGKAIKQISKLITAAQGAVVSLAQSH